jgi:amino acid transporter
MPVLTRKLGLLEAVGVSLSMIGPTLGVAFNTSLVAGAAGPATPLAFAIGTVVIILVGLSFVSFSRDLAHAGSAYAYVRAAFGRRWGFMAGWVMLLGYLAFIGATCALVGNFVDAAVEDCGLHLPHQGLVGSAAALVLAIYCVCRDIRLAARLMLLLEGLSIAAILVLSVVILVKISGTTGLSLKPFHPVAAFDGWSGVGYALVFTTLSFAGFEGRRPSARKRCRPAATSPSPWPARSCWRGRSSSSSPMPRSWAMGSTR